MTEKNKFPKAILQQGIDEEDEILFLSEELKDKKKVHVLMKADNNSVTKVAEPVKIGEELPVYIRLMNRYIFTGSMEMA